MEHNKKVAQIACILAYSFMGFLAAVPFGVKKVSNMGQEYVIIKLHGLSRVLANLVSAATTAQQQRNDEKRAGE